MRILGFKGLTYVQSNLPLCLIQTPHYYGQFALSLGKESPYIFSINLTRLIRTPLIWTLSMDPSVSVFKQGFTVIFDKLASYFFVNMTFTFRLA